MMGDSTALIVTAIITIGGILVFCLCFFICEIKKTFEEEQVIEAFIQIRRRRNRNGLDLVDVELGQYLLEDLHLIRRYG